MTYSNLDGKRETVPATELTVTQLFTAEDAERLMFAALTHNEELAALRDAGVLVRRYYSEWRVNIIGAPYAEAYFTDSYADAIGTARLMVATEAAEAHLRGRR